MNTPTNANATVAPTLCTGIVDVHHADGGYDLAAAKAGGIVALLHKATEGGDLADPAFAAAMIAAKAAGILRGAYHFANNYRSGADQADFFLATVGLTADKGSPTQAELLVLDHETNARSKFGTMDIGRAVAFVERVHERTGRWPVYYSYLSMLGATVRAATPAQRAVLAKCPLWLAAYGPDPRHTAPPKAPPLTPGGEKVTVWADWGLFQYANGSAGPEDRETFPRTVPGWRDPKQDRSAFRGTADDLAVWWKLAGRKEPSP